MLTDDEAVATVLGLAAVERTGPSGATRTAAETAAAKLRRVLPERLATRVAALPEARTTAVVPDGPATGTEVLLTATRAARERRPLRIRHRNRDGEVRERTVLPWGVVEHGGRWYLVGPDSAADAVRTFRLDRVVAAEVGPGRFTRPADVDPVALVLASLAGAPREHTVRVLLHAGEDRVRRHLPASVAVLEPVAGEEGWIRATLEAQHLGWVAGVLALLDAPFRIEEPERLRAEVRALAARLHGRAAEGA
jgi:predicted DNA-binding transcriptional regulator YafY